MHVTRRLLRYILPYWPSLCVALLAMLVTAWCEFGYVSVFSDTTDALKLVDSVGLDRPLEVRYFQKEGYFAGIPFVIHNTQEAFKLVLLVIGLMMVLVVLKATLGYLQTYLVARIRYRVVIRLRREIFQRITFAPLGQIHTERSGDLLSRFIDDAGVIQNAINATGSMLHAAITVLVFLGVMLATSWQLTLLTFLVSPGLAYLLNRFGIRIRQASRQAQGKMADLASLFQETAFGLKVIKAFTAEEKALARFESQIREKYRIVMRRIHLMASMTFLLELISSLAIASVFGFGCWQVIQGRLSIGWFIGYIMMVGMIFKPVKTLGAFNSVLQQGLASAERVFRVLDFDIEQDAEGQKELGFVRGDVEFMNVSFAYGEDPVLHNIHLKARQGETIALVGPSGVGKTTLLNLLPRFYEVSEGTITIDGQSIGNIQLQALRSQIALVPQETILFNGTVLENILYGRPDADTSDVVDAAKQANAHSFIMELPDGYETAIGERGVRLSGGQQQRIAIARAILKNPRILLLDEATSSLDSESESLIQEALRELMQGRTTFVIAHRLSTVIESDQIVVLDQGRIQAIGTHQQLLADNGLYRRLCQGQLAS